MFKKAKKLKNLILKTKLTVKKLYFGIPPVILLMWLMKKIRLLVESLWYLQMKTDGHQDLVGVVSGQKGHEHILQQNMQQFNFKLNLTHFYTEKIRADQIRPHRFEVLLRRMKRLWRLINELFMWNHEERKVKSLPHPVVCSGNHQSVWHQDGCFGLLDVSDWHHWDGDLWHTQTHARMNSSALQRLV